MFPPPGYVPQRPPSTSQISTFPQALQQDPQQSHQGGGGGGGSSNSGIPPGNPSQNFENHPYGSRAVLFSTPPARRPASESRAGAQSSSSGSIRRRISRACDQCNQLRTKCDGRSPCAHCVEFGLGCEYARERKKRGKASKKDLAQQSANPSSQSDLAAQRPSPALSSRTHEPTHTPSSLSDDSSSSAAVVGHSTFSSQGLESTKMRDHQAGAGPQPGNVTSMHRMSDASAAESLRHLAGNTDSTTTRGSDRPSMTSGVGGPLSFSAQGLGAPLEYHQSAQSGNPQFRPNSEQILPQALSGHFAGSIDSSSHSQNYGEPQYPMMNPQHIQGQTGAFHIGNAGSSPLPGLMGTSPVTTSPSWFSFASPSPGTYHPQHTSQSGHTLRYPVLQPLIPNLSAILPLPLACDLLEVYFTSSFSAYMHPLSPYILGYVFRKRSILHPTKPRSCSPALLASMLWVAAQTSDAPFLNASPIARGRTCQKLLELTVGLLRPLIHGHASGSESPNYGNSGDPISNGIALGGFGVPVPASAQGGQFDTTEGGLPGATGTLDDVATYINLATVVSASEYKAASLRWWNVAWSLARELKLYRELPPNPPPNAQGNSDGRGGDCDTTRDSDIDVQMDHREQQMPANVPNNFSTYMSSPSGSVTDEEREERRRIWWLLYTVDRHLALCYNRPLFLLDSECGELLQPIDEHLWQAGDNFTDPSRIHAFANNVDPYRRRGPITECTGHSIFGYFLPLMTILGEIVDLIQAQNHPRFGLRFRSAEEWEAQSVVISQQLEAYGTSLREFERRNAAKMSDIPSSSGSIAENARTDPSSTPSGGSVGGMSNSRMTESIIQTKIVVAYGTHVMHVLHILLTGKWDPISLLDDNDLWISSQSFISATGHAVSAAEAISEILEYDPDLSFMPFFFGIYLLQGSFLLLLIADKLQGGASPSVVKACETIVRATEACIVTLNTEYQRNFRKVMRSALAQIRGRNPEDFGEQQLRRREVLSLYRWTGDGTGLAL
ncbi:MAG: hypothetical protein M1819_001288 [Sarea resinae]|nr:MAG: hypothetical protein M1819_001288 [Sarea resinae]